MPRYPYEAAAAADSHASLGPDRSRRVRYINPLTGGRAMSIIDSQLVQLDPRASTRRCRTSSSAVACVVEGSGESRIGEQMISWRPQDIFTLPQGAWISHSSHETARLFIASDRDLIAHLGLLKKEYADG